MEPSTFNIADLGSNETTTLELTHPVTKEPLGIKITGYTPDSNEYAAIEKRIISELAIKQSVTMQKGNKDELEINIDPKSGEAKELTTIASIISIDGDPNFESTPEAIKELLSQRRYGWMLEQWSNHIDDRANFFG